VRSPSWSTLWRAFVAEQVGPLTRYTLGPLLSALAFPYGWAHRLRIHAYHRHWRLVKQLPCRVISVGNLTLGGTGKTPIVEAISRLLQQEGWRVAILSRGYGGASRATVTIVSDGRNCLATPDVAGDEPLLLAEHLPGVPVIVGADRYAAGMHAIEHFGVHAVILDDGYQHVRLARDLDLLLLDAARPFGNGRLFPRGDLREPPAALARADAVVFTHWEPPRTDPTIAVALSPQRLPIFYSQHEPVDIGVLADGRTLPLAAIKGRRVMAFCGIGAPEHFRQTLQRLQATVVACRAFPDHHPFTRPELDRLIEDTARHDAEILVTTEKDGIRLRQHKPLPEHLWAVRIRAMIAAPCDAWRALLLRNMPLKT
jgi:tetraacyldisaccharide 4'-kinase